MEINKQTIDALWDRCKKDVPMKDYTSFRIGGSIDYMLEPRTTEELVGAVQRLLDQDQPWMIMGNGTNMLVSDKGIRGYIVRLGEDFSKIERKGDRIIAQSGALLKHVATKALDASLTGLEFAHGIPGSIGGAITMNAGAYDSEMKAVVEEVLAIDKQGELRRFSKEEMDFVYRNSRVQRDNLVVVEVVLKLQPGDRDKIQARMEELRKRRAAKQPLEYPSAGSTFKRPEGYYAGQLIDQAGLRGLKHGGAQVSEKHCGFVVNVDHASCQDVVELIKIVQGAVLGFHGVELETEVKVIGER